MLLLFGGILLLSECVALATTLFAVAGVSFAATLLLAAKMYRASAAEAVPQEPAAGVRPFPTEKPFVKRSGTATSVEVTSRRPLASSASG
jgi:hypothetical protein